MIHDDILRILVCPEDRTPLEAADTALVARLNEAIAQRRLKNRGEQTLETELGGALVREDRRIAYPVVNDIPMLLVDQGISLDQLKGG